jgi:hypothetical protein
MSLSWGEVFDDFDGDKEISIYGSVPTEKMVRKGTRRWIPNKRYGDKFHWQVIYRREPKIVYEQRRIDVRGSGRELYRVVAMAKGGYAQLRPRTDCPYVVLTADEFLKDPYGHGLEDGEMYNAEVESKNI